MHYFVVAVGSPSAKKVASFTYAHDTPLDAGQIVTVPLRTRSAVAVILRRCPKPRFATKRITAVLPGKLPPAHQETLRWMSGYYPTEQGAVTRLFLPANAIQKQEILPLPATSPLNPDLPALTGDQSAAIKAIAAASHIAILHGETGTGKTRVYRELIDTELRAGRSVLMLVPEISLSEQLIAVLEQDFSGIIRFHSLMTLKQRRDLWFALSNTTQPHLIIGPRSSLFLPLAHLGMVIIDEAHDSSYKQQQSPYYTALQAAAALTARAGAKLVYGSATPSVSDYYAAKTRGYPIIRLTERPVASKSAHTTSFSVINLRERQYFTRNNILSNQVIDRIRESLKHGRQSLLLLNRRGTAQLIQCETCAWQFRCETCDHTLVYHKDRHAALCHFCGKEYPMPSSCPEDNGTLKLLSVGTKYIEEQCRHLFPQEQIMRIDADAVDRESVGETMRAARSGKASILVGTQLLAKGLDLPLLDTVVILDASRQSNDFLGDERYYQLLHQVIGRGMRGHQTVSILLQTARPDDPIVSWAIHEEWQTFYEHELAERKSFGYPPFRFLGSFRFERATKEAAAKTAKAFMRNVAKEDLPVELLGPMPTITASRGKSEWQIIVKTVDRKALIAAALLAPADFTIDLDPIGT